MRVRQSRVLTSYPILLNVITALVLLPIVSAWRSKDGSTFIVPRRMAHLLKKITKDRFTQDLINVAPTDVETTLKIMQINKIRRDIDISRTPANGNTPDDEVSLTSGRTKRSARRPKETAKQKCRSGKVFVNLAKFQNIIAPSGFYTHYCGATYSLPIGNSTIVQTLSQAFLDAYKTVKKIPSKVLSNPSCCEPKRFHSVYILHQNGGGSTTLKSIPNVKASRCGCGNY